MREKKKKFVKSWIEDIPDEKLTGFTTNSKSNVYKTKDLRVDMQGVSSLFPLPLPPTASPNQLTLPLPHR